MKSPAGREAYFAVDADQQVVVWAPTAEAMLGFDALEALGRPCSEILTGSDVFGRPLYCDRCRACLHAGAPIAPAPHHFFIRHRDGRLLRLVHELVPLPTGPGARALVLLGESSTQPVTPSMDVPAPEGASGALCSFANIIRGLAALGMVADAVPSSGFYQTLDSTLDRVLNLTGGETAEVFLWNRASKEMCLTAHRGLFRSAFRQISRFPANQGYPGLVAATGQPLVTHELLQDPRFLRTRVKEKGVQFYMSVPLLAARGVIGCINIASRNDEAADDTLLQMLSWLAAPLATAAELALLRSQESVDWLEEGEVPARSLPGQVLKAMVEASAADQGLLTLWGPDEAGVDTAQSLDTAQFGDTAQLIVRYHQELLVESYPQQVTPCLGKGNRHSCPACRLGGALIHSEAGGPGRPYCRESMEGARGGVCVPLKVGDRTMGVVSLRFRRPQPVPTRPLALLGAMAPRAGRAFLAVWPSLVGERPPVREAEPCRNVGKRRTSAAEPSTPAPTEARAESEQRRQAPFLDIRCFGRFQIFRDEEPLPPASFGRRQSFTVLKALVTRKGRPVSTEFLAEALWPESYPEAASKRLWVVIHSLRMGLEPGLKSGQTSHFVQRLGDSYSFNPEVPYRLDVEEFLRGAGRGERLELEGDARAAAEAYQGAVRLYRGDFLEDEAYSDWCSAEREYLREIYLGLLKRLAALFAGWGDWDKSVHWHRRALFVDGLREEVHRELMRCLWRAGRRDEALRQYTECRQVLERELGVDPLPETEELYRSILETTA